MNKPREAPFIATPADLLDDQRHIGAPLARGGATRLAQGLGRYIDDIALPRLAHVVYWRSPVAHMRIVSIDDRAAREVAGVIGVFDGSDLARLCKPWVATLSHLAGLKSAPQHALAIERACWQGEPVVAIVAQTRAQAEDALAVLDVQWEGLPAVLDTESALDAATPVIHPELGDNLCFARALNVGSVDDAFAKADVVFEETYRFARHTGVTLEPRCLIADWNAAEERLTVHHSIQAPHMMQDLYCRQFGLEEAKVRVLCHDVGGSFGIKVHAYPDDFATVALSILLCRPVKFVADRLESFVSDIHAREHRIHGRIAANRDGEIIGFEIDDLTGIGPYSVFPRTSGIEGNQVVNLTGGPYGHRHYRAALKVVFQNKTPTCQYRGVGHPIACAVTEALVDGIAGRIGIDPLEFRRLNVIADDAYPATGASGIRFESLSHEACIARARELCDYDALRAEQATLRARGIHRGIGIATVIELTNPGAAFYGVGGARIASQDGATIRLEPTGAITVLSSVGEQGQGTEAIFQQIAADAVGVDIARVRVVTGDTDSTPYGGGTWASRGAGIGGEAVLQAGLALRENILKTAAVILQRANPAGLQVFRGAIVETRPPHEAEGVSDSVVASEGGIPASGNLSADRAIFADDNGAPTPLLTLAELGRIAYFRSDTLPAGFTPELMVTRHYAQRDFPFIFTNGVQVSYVEVDVDTGFVKLLDHWAVEDCGRVINPMLVDEQMRGAIVQGIGGVLLEECMYDEDGSLINGNMADYLVPMAAEMPDIHIAHVQTPTRSSALGAKGAGEAGTAGAPAAVMNAINDALAPFGVRMTDQPITPQKILQALGKA